MSDGDLKKGDLVSFRPTSLWIDRDSMKRPVDQYDFPGIIIDEWIGEELDFYGGPHQRKVFLVYWSNGKYSREYDCYLKKISSDFDAARSR